MPKTETIYTDEELGLNPGWDEQLDPNIRRELKEGRIVRLQNKELAEKVARYERTESFASAGVPQDKRGQAFARIYEGSTDPAEVKGAYEELFGPLPEGAGDSGAGAPTDAERRIADAGSAGSSQGTPGTIDLGDAIKAAKTEAEVLEIIRRAPPEAHIHLPEE